jgi:hypothetical protein
MLSIFLSTAACPFGADILEFLEGLQQDGRLPLYARRSIVRLKRRGRLTDSAEGHLKAHALRCDDLYKRGVSTTHETMSGL